MAEARFSAGLLGFLRLVFPSFISSCGLGGMRPSAAIRRLVASISGNDLAMASVPFLKFDSGDLRLTACTAFAHADINIPHLTTSGLRPISKAFRSNIAQLRFMMLLPAHIGDLAMMMQHLADLAEHQTTGVLSNSIPSDKKDAYETCWMKLFRAELDRRAYERVQPEWHDKALIKLKNSTAPAEMLGTLPPPMPLGLSAMLSSYLTSTWTAFETMCGDLWEAAVNTSPERLAHLKGERRRLMKGSQSRFQAEQPETKSVPLNLLQSHRFDVKDKMGTILRESRFEFSRIQDIREAYALAFDRDSAKIDEVLTDKTIDALHIVRNVIVHQAGLADERYMKAKGNLKLPNAALGAPLLLDGEIVVNMISPVIDRSKKLLDAVDGWLIKHRT